GRRHPLRAHRARRGHDRGGTRHHARRRQARAPGPGGPGGRGGHGDRRRRLTRTARRAADEQSLAFRATTRCAVVVTGDRRLEMTYFPSVRRDGEDVRRLARWSEPPPGDPHKDVTGALHDVSNALTVLLGWVAEARSGRQSPADLDRALAIIEDRARSARDLARRAIGSQPTPEQAERSVEDVVREVVEALSVEAQRARVNL